MKRYSLRLNPLSPIHVGCGTDYDPLSYVIDGNELCTFTPDSLSQVLEPDEFDQLDAIAEMPGTRSLNEMRRFIGQHAGAISDAASHRVQVAPGIVKEYSNVIEGRGHRQGQLEIGRTFFNPYSNHPVIPGSSIKGAIRTAALSNLNKGAEYQNKRDFREENLLGGRFGEDPFRLVKIGDAQIGNPEAATMSKVVYAVNKYRATDGDLLDGKGITVRLETLPSIFDNGGHYYSELTFDTPGDIRGKTPRKELQWTFSQIARMCNDFYRPKLEKDLNILAGENNKWVNSVRLDILNKEIVAKRLDGNTAFILRVGHHSGAESVTMDGARSIQIRRGRGQTTYEKQATTQWFTADQPDSSIGLLPFGWLVVIINVAK